jgi:hypothetical protein
MFNSKEYGIKYYKENSEKIKRRARRWYRKNKNKCYKRICIQSKKRYRELNSEDKRKLMDITRERQKKIPWIRTYRSINSRVRCNKFYVKKGIKSNIRPVQLKYLWFRDKAYLMKKPSIDRKNRNGNYTVRNCRYIELSENLKRRIFSTANR